MNTKRRIRQQMLAQVTRLYPFSSGRARLANHPLFRRISRADEELITWAWSPGGYVKVRLNDFIGRSVFFFGDIDPKITNVVNRLLRFGDTALDVGANIGVITLVMAKAVGAGGCVHAFEPNPAVFCSLLEALTRNGANNVRAHQIALSDQCSSATLRVPVGNAGAATILEDRSPLGEATREVRVNRETLDKFATHANLRNLKLIKIDVECSELAVLTGGMELIHKHRPSIVMELNDKQRSGACVDTLHSLQYEVFGIAKSWFSVQLTGSLEHTHDIVAIPREHVQRLRAVFGRWRSANTS